MRKNLALYFNFFFFFFFSNNDAIWLSRANKRTGTVDYANSICEPHPSIHSGCACTTYRLNNQNQRPLLVNMSTTLTRSGPQEGSKPQKKKRKKEMHIGYIVATFSLFTYQMNNSTDIFRHFESSQHFHLAGLKS